MIILVHGTWARGFCLYRPRRRKSSAKADPASTESRRRWFEPRSKFIRDLRIELRKHDIEPIFHRCLWSGANSLKRRTKAAARLHAKLKRLSSRRRDRRRVIIGHSHGGNVALQAIEQLEDLSGVELVTIATPFVSLVLRDFPIRLAVLAMVTVGLGALGVYELLQGSSAPALPLLAIITGAVLNILAIGLLLAGFDWGGKHAERVSHRGRTPIPTLCLRGPSDEASLALTFGAIGAELARLITDGLSASTTVLEPVRRKIPAARNRRGAIVFYGAFLLVVVFLTLLFTPVSTTLVYLAAATIAGWTISFFLAGLSLSILGRELLWSGVSLIPSVESVPDGEWNVSVLTLRSPASGFRHPLYRNDRCIPELARWIARWKVRASCH